MGRQASPKRKVRPYLQPSHQLFNLETVRLVALLLGSIFISLWLANSRVTANSLFQSPASPVTSPEVNQPPVEAQPPAEPQPPAAEQPPPAEQQPPAEQPPDQPQPQQPVESQPSLDSSAPAPATQELESPPLTEAEPAEPAPTAGQSRRERERTGQEQEQAVAADESPNFILDQAEFIDTVVVSGAYIWLCCGVLLFLLVPIFMLVLYIRGRSKLGRDEGF